MHPDVRTPGSPLPMTPSRARGSAALDFPGLPILLRPALRAYVLGYASAVGPRLLTLLLQHISRRRKKRLQQQEDDQNKESFVDGLARIIRTGLEPQRFPAFCAALIGGNSLLLPLLKRVIDKSATSLSLAVRQRLARWLSAFIAGWLSLRLLQSKDVPAKAPHEDQAHGDDGVKATEKKPRAGPWAGRTLDLTLFTITRAVDVLVGELWSQHRARRKGAQKWTKTEQFATDMIDPAVFAVSCGFIMWSWFYHPDALPRSYNKWITSAAMVDLRLIKALKRCKTGELLYGHETGQAPLLGSMCADNGWPQVWGDPSKTIPFPCEIVHMGCGSSCEYHAVSRFVRSWKWAMFTYLPLAVAFKMRKPSRQALANAVVSACRSSAFLGTFITLFYYGVCLGRTRVGPRLLGTDTASRQRIDGGVCVGTGCFLCGWSVLIETAGRRKDMALFVAPRALATVVPRRYPRSKQWRETAAFAASAAVVLTCVAENPKRVRGVLGGVLNMVTRE